MERLKMFVISLTLCCTMFHTAVSNIQMSISPTQVTLGSAASGTTRFECTIAPGLSINTIYNMQIKRQRHNENSYTVIAQVQNTAPSAPEILDTDINSRGTVSEGIDTSNLQGSKLILTLNAGSVRCNDKGYYQCSLTYADSGSTTYTVTNNGTLNTYALPSDLGLTSNVGSITQNASVSIGTVVQLTCSGNIGSRNTTLIEWRRTSFSSSQFLNYIPSVHSDGTASVGNDSCRFTRTATMNYNITSADSNRPASSPLAFRCFIRDTSQNNYETHSMPIFYSVASSGGGSTGGSTDEAAGASTGIIVGSVIGGLVFVVLIVVLVYFLWYRKRGDGEDYRTKEETGGSNPNIVGDNNDVTYAIPNKKRGQENQGMDERHTHRHYEDDDDGYYNNPRGRSNYAMDDDDQDDHGSYRRESPPTINHMGLEPDGSYGTGV